MKILVNATTITIGGGVQNVVSMVIEALQDNAGHEFHLAVSGRVADEMPRACTDAAASIHVLRNSPARDRAARRELLAVEAKLAPDCIFTFNGPAYVKFRAPHLLGFATPWVTHPTLRAYRTLSFPTGWISIALASRYKAHWFRFADAWVTETTVSKLGLARRLGLDPNKIFVVSNSCGSRYAAAQGERPFPAPNAKLRILCFAAPYPHKRLEWLPWVARALAARCPGLNFEFVVTLPEDSPMLATLRKNAVRLGVESRFKNEGRIAVPDGPGLYQTCDICFMPTVLETFSATYPEAMAMGLPIVTTNLSFATDVCRDAALYFDTGDAAAAADCIGRLIADEDQWRTLIANGKTVLAALPTARDKCEAYLQILQGLIDQPVMAPAASNRS